MHTNHKLFCQIQGQLEIADLEACVFGVFKVTKDKEQGIIHELESEVIQRDRYFWKEKMLPKLKAFFFNCFLPGKADSRLDRGLSMRNINIHDNL